jgi:hypothetical protein
LARRPEMAKTRSKTNETKRKRKPPRFTKEIIQKEIIEPINRAASRLGVFVKYLVMDGKAYDVASGTMKPVNFKTKPRK